MLVAGIDGGQSSTVAAVGDAARILGRGSGPPADLVGEPRDSTRQAAALDAALDAALSEAGLARTTRFAAIVAGISGFDEGLSLPPDLTARAPVARVVHDTIIAHAGALDGAAGIVVIAGTGSVALGTSVPHGPPSRAGGWGYFFGDEGSALWIARTALRRAMGRSDRGESSRLGDRALEVFSAPTLRDIQHAFAHGALSRPRLAAFANDVLELARSGDGDARNVRQAAAAELAGLAAVVDRSLEPAALRLVSFAGGLFSDGAFVDAFGEALELALPHGDLREPVADPAAGALHLARALA
jgi:N-acetylglucosamine kinase-like BadF-type ATPase